MMQMKTDRGRRRSGISSTKWRRPNKLTSRRTRCSGPMRCGAQSMATREWTFAAAFLRKRRIQYRWGPLPRVLLSLKIKIKDKEPKQVQKHYCDNNSNNNDACCITSCQRTDGVTRNKESWKTSAVCSNTHHHFITDCNCLTTHCANTTL